MRRQRDACPLDGRGPQDTLWIMPQIQIASVDAPLSRQTLADRAFSLVLRATAVGLLAERDDIVRLDLDLLREIAREAAALGIGKEAALGLLQENPSPARLAQLIEQLEDALAQSPIPDRELRELRRTFELDQLARLLGTSQVSLRRYLGGSRTVPDELAARAHWLALVSADLAGSYNEIGIRRWFDRPRGQLDGRSPREELGPKWDPDDAAALRVRNLAAALVGPAAAT
jgi:hypothetical protein